MKTTSRDLTAAIYGYNVAAERYIDDPDPLNARAFKAAQRYLIEVSTKHKVRVNYTQLGTDRVARLATLSAEDDAA